MARDGAAERSRLIGKIGEFTMALYGLSRVLQDVKVATWELRGLMSAAASDVDTLCSALDEGRHLEAMVAAAAPDDDWVETYGQRLKAFARATCDEVQGVLGPAADLTRPFGAKQRLEAEWTIRTVGPKIESFRRAAVLLAHADEASVAVDLTALAGATWAHNDVFASDVLVRATERSLAAPFSAPPRVARALLLRELSRRADEHAEGAELAMDAMPRPDSGLEVRVIADGSPGNVPTLKLPRVTSAPVEDELLDRLASRRGIAVGSGVLGFAAPAR